MDFQSGKEITAGSTNDETLNLITPLPDFIGPEIIVGILVTSGTVKFANGESASSNYGRTPSDGVFYTFHSPNCPVHFDAASATDKFVVTVVG